MTNIDYIYESYFAVLGLTGAGKSSFLNAISETDCCLIGSLGKACTQANQLVSFVFNNHRYNAIDTPGLDDTDNNDQKVSILKGLLSAHPKIKKIIIVKKYNDLRLPLSMQNAIITFMEAFPLQNFWDHVIIVNSWANPHDESFTEKQIHEACEYVNADSFIDKMPKGINEEIIEKGENLSQGQRQLLSFARTVIHKPQILILDEATANIDTETENIIQTSLEKMRSIGTMIIVAHRLSTIKNANIIFVVKKGRIIEQGTHQELLKQKGNYYNLYRLQNMEKSLAKPQENL